MNVVLDANVLLAALIARGVCSDLLEHCVVNHNLITAKSILDDVREHLVEKFNYSENEGNEARELFESQMTLVVPQKLATPVCRDSDDDLVLGSAVAWRSRLHHYRR